MRASWYEIIWLAAVFAFMAYPVGDILNFWDIQAPAILLASSLLLLSGWNVGKRRQSRHG